MREDYLLGDYIMGQEFIEIVASLVLNFCLFLLVGTTIAVFVVLLNGMGKNTKSTYQINQENRNDKD